jgi:biopolymer transport protein ExbB
MRLHTIADEDLAASTNAAPRTRWMPWILILLLVTAPLAATTMIPLAGTTPKAPAVEQVGEQEARPSLFWFVTRSLGVVFGPLLLCDFIFWVSLVVLLSSELRVTAAIPAAFVENFTDLVNRRQFKAAFDLARKDSSFLALVLTAGMGRLQYGLEEARLAARTMTRSLQVVKSQLNNYLTILAIISPMLGLVATLCGVTGVLLNAPQPGINLSAAIGQCLVPTVVGIVLTLLATVSYFLCRNQLTRVTMDVDSIADDLLTQMYHNSKGKGLASGWN